VEEVNQGIEQFLDKCTVSSYRLPESRLASSTQGRDLQIMQTLLTINDLIQIESAIISHVLDPCIRQKCIKYNFAFYK
jgi:hypothetical protein